MKEDPFKVYGDHYKRFAINPRVIYDESSPVPTAAKLKAIQEMFAKRFNVQGTMSGRISCGPSNIPKSKAPDATSDQNGPIS